MIFQTKVIYKILNKFTYLVPKLLRLNYLYYINFFIGDEAEHEMYKLDKFIKKKGFAIDVGANLGLYSFALTKIKKIKKIYSFEPNKTLTKYLKLNKKIKVFHYALSNKKTNSILSIPFINGIEYSGWGFTNDKNIWPLNTKFKKKKILSRRLDSFNFKNICFIKIDVEGNELEVLEGGRKLFLDSKPNCLIEIQKINLRKVKNFFSSLNCNYRLIKNNEVHKNNYLFLI